MKKPKLYKQIVEIEHGDLDIYVDKQFVLHIGQVSTDEVINLYFYPQHGDIFESELSKEVSDHECTHELTCIKRR